MQHSNIKKISIAAFVVMLLTGIVFAQDTAQSQNDYHVGTIPMPAASEPRFDVSASISWYPSSLSSSDLRPGTRLQRRSGKVPTAPFRYQVDDGFNLRLNMGSKIYNDWGAYFDFGIDDQDAERLVDLMAKLGNRFFDLSFEYTKNRGRLSAWDARFGTEADNAMSEPPNQILDYDNTWLKVVFVLKKNIMVGGTDGMPIGGFFFAKATVPIAFASELAELPWNDETMTVPAENAAAFFDPVVNMWAVGIRIGIDGMSEPPVSGRVIEGGLVSDFGLGWSDLDKDLVEEARALNPDFDAMGVSGYYSGRLYFGLGHKSQFGGDNLLYLIAGMEMYPQRFTVIGSSAKHFLPLTMRNIGPYAYGRLKF